MTLRCRIRYWLAGLLAVGLVGCGSGAGLPPAPALVSTPYSPDSGSLAVHCGSLVDGVSAQPRSDVTVEIRDGRISAVVTGARPVAGLPWLDLPQHTCLPGLIDMHVHITELDTDIADYTVYYRRTDAEHARISADSARATLLAGFTTVRNVGNYNAWMDRALRDEINAGRVAGPRLQVAGFYLTVPGGGGDLVIPGYAEELIPARIRTGVTRGPAQFRERAQAAVAGGADFLKVIASGAVLSYGGVPGASEMTPEEIAAVVEVGHAAGLKVAAHSHGAQSIKEAIRAGVDTIEHASLIDEEGIQLARQRDVALVMDVYNGDYTDSEGRRQGWPEEFLRKNIETTEVQRQAFTRAVAVGAPIAYGTDGGVFPHGFNARQFPMMVARGMTPMQAIRSATSVAARYLGWADRVGELTPGRFGDLIAVRGDPLADIGVLQDVDVVIKGGLAFKLPAGGAPR